MSQDGAREAFERAFVAVSYLLDRRGPDLLQPLGDATPAARDAARALGHADRQVRATVLARELAAVSRALDAWRLQ